MIRIKDHKTRYMFDPFGYLGQKRKKLLDDFWPGTFREHVRPILPVELLAKHFSEDMGRPANELVAMMGAMILQQMHDLTDEETVNQFAFSIQWHYALDITGNSDKDAYVSPKSIWTIRHIMSEHDLYEAVFERVADHLGKVFDADYSLQRLDSVHIFSNMRHLGRIGIFVKTIQKFLTNLKRHHRDLFDGLGQEFTARYLCKEEESSFSMVKPSESSRTLEILGNGLFFLIERFGSLGDVTSMSSYQLMARVLKEQCLVTEDPDTDARKVTIKANKEVASDSLQNPSDPDATGLSVEDMLEAAAMLETAGIDAIELSGGTAYSGKCTPVRQIRFDSEDQEAYHLGGARRYKEKVGVPLMLVGGIRSYGVAEGLLRKGLADYISLSRPLIREPHLINRWKSGDTRRAMCQSDNLCFDPVAQGEGIYCVVEKRLKAKQA